VGDHRYALFPCKDLHNRGALVQGPGAQPSPHGIRVYLNGGKDVQGVLDRVKEAGGTVQLVPTLVAPEAGIVAMFLDSEGNCVGLQTPPPTEPDPTVSDDQMVTAAVPLATRVPET
jgi:predicted enzyme related to lactoylglutathione lyase